MQENKNNQTNIQGNDSKSFTDIKTGRDFTYNQNTYNISGKEVFSALSQKVRQKIQRDFYLRLNRELQERDFSKFMSQKQTFSKPFLFFTHGFRDDEQTGFVSRLGEIIKKEFSGAFKMIDLGSWVNQPEKKTDDILFNFKDSLRKKTEEFLEHNKVQYKFPRAYANYSFLQEIPLLSKFIISFELNIYIKFWTKELAEVLEKNILKELLNFELTNIEKPVFLFVHLIYEPEKTGIKALFGGNNNKKAEKEITDLCKRNKNDSYIFKKLCKIEYNDADQFLKKYGLVNLNEFIKDEEKLSFEEFFGRCKNLVAEFHLSQHNNAI